MQLNKHMTSVAMLVAEDILTQRREGDAAGPRRWHQRTNAVAFCTWLFGFFDSLLYWEEISGSKQFCEVLSPSHRFSIGKLFQLLPEDIRKDAIAITDKQLPGLPHFCKPRAKRLSVDTLLVKALQKSRVSIQEMELAIPFDEDSEKVGAGRRSKRARRT